MTSRNTVIIVFLSMLTIHFGLTQTGFSVDRFQGFPIDWVDFSLIQCMISTTIDINTLQCSLPRIIDLSLFNCLPRPDYIYVSNLSCINWISSEFNQNTCTTSETTPSQQTYVSQTQVFTQAPITGYTAVNTQTVSYATILQSTVNVQASTAINRVQSSSPTSISTDIRQSTVIATSTQAETTFAQTSTSKSTTVTSSLFESSTQEFIQTSITTPVHTSTQMPTSIQSTVFTTKITGTTMLVTAGTVPPPGPDLILKCPDGSLGADCNIASDPCSMAKPCQNDATCFPNQTVPSGYICHCVPGFSGDSCEQDNRPCKRDTCWNNGTCSEVDSANSSNGLSFECLCDSGFTGVNCELEIDMCVNITCLNDGFCQTVDMNWKCICLTPSLYYGDLCEHQTAALKVFKAVSRSMASVAVTSIVLTLSFFVFLDILKYVFHVDTVAMNQQNQVAQTKASKVANAPQVAVRFQYIS